MRKGNLLWTVAGALCFGLILALAGVGFCGDRGVNPITFESSAVHTAGTEYSTGFLVGAYAEGLLLVNISGVSGVPTCRLVAETSSDNSTYFYHSDVATIAGQTGTTAYAITNYGKYLRMKQVISGADGNETITYEIKGVFKN